MSLKEEISAWNGKSKSAISEIYACYHTQEDFLEVIIELLSHEETEVGSSWLIKHHFDVGGEALSDNLVTSAYSAVPVLTHWEAKLHVLQIMTYLPIPEGHKSIVEAFLLEGVEAQKTLIRAWSYYGLALFALGFPEYHEKIYLLLEQKQQVETSGSIRVRLRKAIDALERTEPV